MSSTRSSLPENVTFDILCLSACRDSLNSHISPFFPSVMQRDSTCLTLSATISTYWRKTTLASDMWTQTNREYVKSITIHPTNEIAEKFNLVGLCGELIQSLLLSVFSHSFFPFNSNTQAQTFYGQYFLN